ncbi:ATP-binding cassette domain-containing protein [Methanolobus sp. ZRKC3]|uniref:ABC transporter ATP-binding protein n=1 Tax=Methanolobus sp. ZRKC3 TaxID=3125786 RepID=UPI0032494A14
MPGIHEDNTNHTALIEMSELVVSRQGKNILDSISLRIEQGENVAIVGPNGSGKSSTIKVITGDYRPLADSQMDFRILGKELWNISELRSLLGIVSGELQVDYNREIYGFDVVLSGFFSSIGIYPNHKVKPEMMETVLEVMKFLDIAHLYDKMISEMSTGEARRLLIGRALVHDPKVLVLDEPANSLDIKSHYQFRETTRKIAAHGKSIILVTHNLEDIIPEIGRVILLKNGKVFADGKKEDMLTEEKLTELFELPVHVVEKDGYYNAWC